MNGEQSMNIIETSGLGKRYGSTWALRECSLAIPAGHVAALVGQDPGLRPVPWQRMAWVAGNIRAVPRPARVHAVDELPARQPVLAVPVDRGRLAGRVVGAAHRRGRLAGPPPGRLTCPEHRRG